MSRWLDAARQAEQQAAPPSTKPTEPTKPAAGAVVSVSSVLSNEVRATEPAPSSNLDASDPKAVLAARGNRADGVTTIAEVATPEPCAWKLSQGHVGEDWPFAPDLDAFAERAAIAEYDGSLSRSAAEWLAAQEQGFADPVALRAAAVTWWREALDGLAAHETSPCRRAWIRNAQRFVAGGWGAQAAALGWTEPELFGLCPVAPWARPDRMGAAWLGRDVAAVTAECIRLASGLRVWRATRVNGLRVPWFGSAP